MKHAESLTKFSPFTSVKLPTPQPLQAPAGLEKLLGDDDDVRLILFYLKGSVCQTEQRSYYNAARVCQYDLDFQRLLSGVIACVTYSRLRIPVSIRPFLDRKGGVCSVFPPF